MPPGHHTGRIPWHQALGKLRSRAQERPADQLPQAHPANDASIHVEAR